MLRQIKKLDEFIYNKFSKYSNFKFFKIIDFFGSFVFVVSIIIIFYIIPDCQFNILSIIFLLSIILNTISVFVIKNLIRRKRSFYDNTYVGKIDPYSFPSGHTSRLSGFLIPAYPFPILFILLILFTVIVSLSRMIKGYHFFSDCIAGLIIGLINGFIADFLFKLIVIRYFSIIFKIPIVL